MVKLFALLRAAWAFCAAGPARAHGSLVFLDSTNLAVGSTWRLRVNRIPNSFAWIHIHNLEAARYQKVGS